MSFASQPVNGISTCCFFCQEPTTPELHPILGAPVCSACLRQRPYSEANTLYVGEPDGLPDFSIEFEVSAYLRERERALALLKHHYIRTEDCTVSDEYKSPRYHSLASFQEALPTLHSLRDLVDEQCGTHIHVDCAKKVKICLNNYHLERAIFGALAEYVDAHDNETIRFWGRSHHALIYARTRYNTIEFRKAKFRTATQYLTVVKFCRQVASNLAHHLNPDASCYETLPPQQLGESILALYQSMLPAAIQEEAYV